MKRTPLEILAFTVMVVALIVIVLSFSHIFGIGILSRLFPEIGEPGHISFYPRFMIFITLVLPAFILFSFLYVISVPLRYVLARKRHSGYRTDSSNTITIYDELDRSMTLYYDGLNRLTKTEKYLPPQVLTETYIYDYQNNVISTTDAGGHTYTYEYDSQGRTTKMTNPDSAFNHFSYDNTTNTVTFFDENNHRKDYHYDWTGNLLWVKEYNTECYTTEYTYDGLGNLLSVTDAKGNTTSYSYDSLYGVTEVIYPDSTTETISYDAVGNPLQKTNPNGTTTLTYNAIYQLVGVLNPDQSSLSFEYDPNGNLTSMVDPESQTTYTYDNRNRLLSETKIIQGQIYTLAYQYDAASQLVSLTYPDQSVTTFEYDSLGRLVSIPGYAEFTYNTDSLLSSAMYANGTSTTYQYNECCHNLVTLRTQKDGQDLLLNYEYDPAGNVTQFDYGRLRDQWVESSEIFSYDCLNRLVSAQGDYGVLTYSYDPAGNRLSQNEVTYTYNSMNELLSSSDGTQFTYDENGNRIQKTKGSDTWVYTYDYANRLKKVEKNGIPLGEYVYDGQGSRIQVQENGDTTTCIYQGINILYEENSTGTASYVYGPAGRLAKTTTIQNESHTFYYHTDSLGSTRLVTDESGNIVTEATYTPFGESAVAGEPYLYTGKQKDATGLYFYGARYYDPETGRFITRDPLPGRMKAPQSLNRYTYCLNNPVNSVDPAGLVSECFHDADTGMTSCTTDSGWILTDANGNTLSSEEVQQKIDEGDYAGAVKMILEFLGYEVTQISEKELQVTMGDHTVHITVLNSDEVLQKELYERKWMKGPGRTFIPKKEEKDIYVEIFFTDDFNRTAAELFHAVGHEMVHAKHFATGVFYIWQSMWGQNAAVYHSDVIAYNWNLANLRFASFPGAQEGFQYSIDMYIALFIMDAGVSVWKT